MLSLFFVGLLVILLYGSRRVPFNKDYLSLATAKQFKGWCSLVIVLFHLFTWGIDIGGIFIPFDNVGYLALAVFFFFSGFGSQKRYMTVPNYDVCFLEKRMPAILVPYFVVVICYIVIQSYHAVELDYLRIFFPFTGDGEPLIPYTWYIFAIAIFYLVFCGTMKCFKNNYKVSLICVVFYCVAWTIFTQGRGFHSSRYWSIIALPLGMLLAMKEKELTFLLQKFYTEVLLLLLILGVYMMLLYSYWGKDFSILVFGNFCSVLCIFALLLFSAKIQIGNKILHFLGNIYLEIYLVHGCILYGVYSHYGGNKFVWCVIILASSILGASVLHQLCKKPLQTYQEHLKHRCATEPFIEKS